MPFRILPMLSCILCLTILSHPSLAQTPSQDPLSNYILQGQTVSPWKMTVGNQLKWYIKAVDGKAETLRQNLTVTRVISKEGDLPATKLKWAGKYFKSEWNTNLADNSIFTIDGHNIDVSSLGDQAVLAMNVRVIRAPNKNVVFRIGCNSDNRKGEIDKINNKKESNKKCKTELSMKKALRKLPKKKWSRIPLPLKCFEGEKFDATDITEPLSITTNGKLEIEIESLTLAALPLDKIKC